MPLDAVKDLAREVVEASTEFGSTAANRPRLQDGLVALVGLGASGTALVEGVVTAFSESTFLAAVDTEVEGEAVSATGVPYLGVTVLDEGDTVYLAVLGPETFVVVGAIGVKGSDKILCVDPGEA